MGSMGIGGVTGNNHVHLDLAEEWLNTMPRRVAMSLLTDFGRLATGSTGSRGTPGLAGSPGLPGVPGPTGDRPAGSSRHTLPSTIPALLSACLRMRTP